jgi:hypothetical protein
LIIGLVAVKVSSFWASQRIFSSVALKFENDCWEKIDRKKKVTIKKGMAEAIP